MRYWLCPSLISAHCWRTGFLAATSGVWFSLPECLISRLRGSFEGFGPLEEEMCLHSIPRYVKLLLQARTEVRTKVSTLSYVEEPPVLSLSLPRSSSSVSRTSENTPLRRTLQPVEKAAHRPIAGPAPGSKRPKTRLSAPRTGSEKGTKEFFNRLTPSPTFGE